VKEFRRAIGASLSLSIGVGAVFAAVVVLASEREPLLPRLSATFLGDIAMLGLFASMFVSVPAGVLGGMVAGAMLRRHKALSRGQWLSRGAAVGCGIGATSSLLYGLVLSGLNFSGGASLAFLLYVVAGAICGGLCGVVLGWWCSSHQSRSVEVLR
jgi:hypothetical protein